ncbi:MAG: HNH endonuclease signature motif containing protein [Desulfobacteraceae bacterium]|jgi:hypothetical protein
MILAEFIASETEIPIDSLLLLRHSNKNLNILHKCGGSIEEYTSIQPVGSKYDYYQNSSHPIKAIIVIANDRVYGVFRINGISYSGKRADIGSAEYREFIIKLKRPGQQECHCFDIERIPSAVTDEPVYGWERRALTPVQRFGGSFFDEIKVNAPAAANLAESIRSQFQNKVSASLLLPSIERAERLKSADPLPKRITVVTSEFVRNPDVVAEVLIRAQGTCEKCLMHAPFLRKSDGSPYLEVHHRKPLSQGGRDTVENAQALCPNCHRQLHYGDI